MFKVNDRNTRKRCEICSKLTIKTSATITWSHTSNQIKGESQLSSLHETVEFLSKKFDDLVKEKDEQIKNSTQKKQRIKEKNWRPRNRAGRQEQYSKRNCMLLHGIEEIKKENTDSLLSQKILGSIQV